MYLSLSDLTFASNREGIDNPFIALGASLFDWLCRYSVICALSPTGLIPLFSNWGKYLSLLCCITLSSSREKPTQAQKVAGRISGAVAREIYPKSRHTKYPSQLLSFALHYLPFASRFPLPHFTLAVLFALFSLASSSWLVLYLLLCLPRMKFLILNKGREKI